MREPLGEPKGSEQDEYDDLIAYPETIHGIASDNDSVVATGRMHRQIENPGLLQVRYMATRPDYRGQGIGARILAHMENEAKALLDVEAIVLNARIKAANLYAKSGYAVTSGIIELHGLPHVQMRKELS